MTDAAWLDAGAREDAATDASVDVGPPSDTGGPSDAAPIDAASSDDAAPPCVLGTRRCSGADLEECGASGWSTTDTCGLPGCGDGGGPTAHCLEVVPSHLMSRDLEGSWAGEVAGSMMIDTDACSGEGMSPGVGDVCVYRVASLRVDAGSKIDVTGARPLVIVARGDVTIAGRIIVKPRASGPAPESDARTGRNGSANRSDDGGGGGGSFCGAGGRGGNGGSTTTGGAPGATASPSELLTSLRGGAAGGMGSPTARVGVGGARGLGGGAIQITSLRGAITLGAPISAVGGGGGGGQVATSGAAAVGAGGGGGSGGAIFLEAFRVDVATAGALDVRGAGGGGGGCSSGGGGSSSVSAGGADGGSPEDDSIGRASGGAAGSCGARPAFPGGSGGASSGSEAADAANGQPGADVDANGGGGGGGAGCVFIRDQPGSPRDGAHLVPPVSSLIGSSTVEIR